MCEASAKCFGEYPGEGAELPIDQSARRQNPLMGQCHEFFHNKFLASSAGPLSGEIPSNIRHHPQSNELTGGTAELVQGFRL
jgi:hypothetical protein